MHLDRKADAETFCRRVVVRAVCSTVDTSRGCNTENICNWEVRTWLNNMFRRPGFYFCREADWSQAEDRLLWVSVATPIMHTDRTNTEVTAMMGKWLMLGRYAIFSKGFVSIFLSDFKIDFFNNFSLSHTHNSFWITREHILALSFEVTVAGRVNIFIKSCLYVWNSSVCVLCVLMQCCGWRRCECWPTGICSPASLRFWRLHEPNVTLPTCPVTNPKQKFATEETLSQRLFQCEFKDNLD